MKPPPESIEHPPTANINTIPNELLAKVLAFVPYYERVHTDAGVRLRHNSLKLVSSRFKSIVSTTSYRTEVFRLQYHDEAQLYGIDSITTDQQLRTLIGYATLNRHVADRCAVVSKTHLPASLMRPAFLILDYLHDMNRSSDIKARMVFVKWACKTIFSRDIQLLLRYTLERFHDVVFFSSPSIDHLAASLPWPNTQIDSVKDMFKYRSFETAVLLNSAPEPLLATIHVNRHAFVSPIAEQQGDQFLMLHACYMQSWLQGIDRQPSVSPVNNKRYHEYLSGYQWRPFNDTRVSLTESNLKDKTLAITFPEVQKAEKDCDQEMIVAIKEYNRAYMDYATLPDIDLKAIGEFLRSATAKIEAGDKDIPEEVKHFAEEATMLVGFRERH